MSLRKLALRDPRVSLPECKIRPHATLNNAALLELLAMSSDLTIYPGEKGMRVVRGGVGSSAPPSSGSGAELASLLFEVPPRAAKTVCGETVFRFFLPRLHISDFERLRSSGAECAVFSEPRGRHLVLQIKQHK